MKVFMSILAIIPAMMGIIASIERLFPQANVGGEKLNLLKTILSEAYGGVAGMWAPLEKIAAAVVAFANKIGAFTTNKTI
jgi:hypothetical protein